MTSFEKDFIDEIKKLPLSESMKNDLGNENSLANMRKEWEESSKIERQLWLSGICLTCLAEHIEEHKQIPKEHASNAMNICVTLVKNLYRQKILGNDHTSYLFNNTSVLEHELRRIASGVHKGDPNNTFFHNNFLETMSSEPSHEDYFLYEIMTNVFDEKEIKKKIKHKLETFNKLGKENSLSLATGSTFESLINAPDINRIKPNKTKSSSFLERLRNLFVLTFLILVIINIISQL